MRSRSSPMSPWSKAKERGGEEEERGRSAQKRRTLGSEDRGGVRLRAEEGRAEGRRLLPRPRVPCARGKGSTRSREFLGYPARGRQRAGWRRFRRAVLWERALPRSSTAYRPSDPKKGFIELERVLVKKGTLERSRDRRGQVGSRSSRGGPLGTEHTLGQGAHAHFDEGASLFIGDADIYPGPAAEYDRYRKPSPKALVRASKRLQSKMLLYVGDSAEDLMMVRDGTPRAGSRTASSPGYTRPPPSQEADSLLQRERCGHRRGDR